MGLLYPFRVTLRACPKGLGTIHSSFVLVFSSYDFVWTISEESVQSFSHRSIHSASSMQKPNANANKILRRAYSIRPYNNGGKYRWIMHDYTMILAHPLIPVGERRRATSWFKSKPWPIRWVSLSNPKSPTLSGISTSLDNRRDAAHLLDGQRSGSCILDYIWPQIP